MTTIISAQKTDFLKFELENGTAHRKKRALQELVHLNHVGLQLNAEGRNAFEKLINGMVLSEADLKVVRWYLNVLARLGTRQGSGCYIEVALKKHEDKPEIVAAAAAALSHIYNGNLEEAPCLNGVDPAIRILAALQTTSPKRLDISFLRIDIDKADAEVLKLALITIGLNKDVDNLFHPRHSNGMIVKALGQHDDKIVRQYSVWSVLENDKLTMDDLGIPFSDIDKEPPNVQAKLLQLAAEREKDVKRRDDIISIGSASEHPEAREGLAKGLLQTYDDGFEEITIPWFDVEECADIRELLAEHFARFSNTCNPYQDKALSIIEAEPKLKSRILVGAEGKPLYRMVKVREIGNGMADLFAYSDDLLRRFDMATTLQTKRNEMKVLFLAASPTNGTRLRLDKEANDLRQQLALVKDCIKAVEVQHQWATRTDQIQMEILNHKPDILHFSGHGDVGMLIFEDGSGEAAPVSSKAIAELISLCGTVRCLLLNACYSESVAKLVAPHVEAVIGCNATINDDAAIAFTRAFYRALAHGCTFVEAYKLAKNEVRINGYEKEADKYLIYSK